MATSCSSIRDHYGLHPGCRDVADEAFKTLEGLRVESVITVEGEVVRRDAEAINPNLATGQIEIHADKVEIQSAAQELPLPVFGDQEYPEEIRLRYRYLDLRRERLHNNIILRSEVISSIRRRMIDQGFTEFQTPILTWAFQPRRRPRSSRPEPRPSRQVLRASAGAADVQAAAHGRRFRSLFPDRALLPRRGRPRRPLARRVLSASISK
jgi:hypothetical protein